MFLAAPNLWRTRLLDLPARLKISLPGAHLSLRCPCPLLPNVCRWTHPSPRQLPTSILHRHQRVPLL